MVPCVDGSVGMLSCMSSLRWAHLGTACIYSNRVHEELRFRGMGSHINATEKAFAFKA
jgi:hypothetical protein